MAQKRMLDKKISVSEQVANLELKGKLLFTWMIPHADDLGLLPFSSKTIKALVVPMDDDFSVEDVGFQLEAMQKQGLIKVFSFEGDNFWQIKGFLKNQTLKKDRQPNTIVPLKLKEDFKKNWQLCENMILESISVPMETNGFQMETNGNQIVPEVKGSKEKRSNLISSENEDIAPIGASPLKDLLEKKEKEIGLRKVGGQTSWQDAADRTAKSLSISINKYKEYAPSWFKIFKEADTNADKNKRVQIAYGWLVDNPAFLEADDEGRIKLFFHVYHNGVPRK